MLKTLTELRVGDRVLVRVPAEEVSRKSWVSTALQERHCWTGKIISKKKSVEHHGRMYLRVLFEDAENDGAWVGCYDNWLIPLLRV